MLKDLILKSRSYRRFHEELKIDHETLMEFVDLARLSPSGKNMQPLKYILSSDPEKNEMIFPHLRWAAAISDWPGPGKGERPAAYIIILEDTQIKHILGYDQGIAAQSILLGATEKGLGGCMIANIDRKGLRQSLNISDRFKILLVIAIGKPKEEVVIDPVGPDGDVSYFRDENMVHHVPKRALDDIIIDD